MLISNHTISSEPVGVPATGDTHRYGSAMGQVQVSK